MVFENINELLGETLINIERRDNEIIFDLENGKRYLMYHAQNCCEDVYIEDIAGNLNDLVGNTLLVAETATKEGESGESLFTFYKFRTIKGDVTVRWYGTTDSVYALSVDLREIK